MDLEMELLCSSRVSKKISVVPSGAAYFFMVVYEEALIPHLNASVSDMELIPHILACISPNGILYDSPCHNNDLSTELQFIKNECIDGHTKDSSLSL